MSLHVYEYDSKGNSVEGSLIVAKDYDELLRLVSARVSTPGNKRSEMAFQVLLSNASLTFTGTWKDRAKAAYGLVDAFLALEQ